MQALLNIDDYVVEDFDIATNEDYKRPQKDEASGMAISFDIKRKGKEPLFMLTLKVDLNKSERSASCGPYRLSLRISGFFSFTESVDEETMHRMIGLNGISILYGLARGAVAQFTATCRHGKFLLPSVNFVELLKEKAEKPEESPSKRARPKRSASRN